MSRRKILASIIVIFFIFTSLGLSSIRKKYVAPILMYHSVNPYAVPENRLVVSVGSFERQMRFLKRYYNVLALEHLASLIKENKIPPRSLAITFDDGYKDNYTNAFPVLKKYNLPATMFVIVEEVDRSDRLSWDEIKEMQGSGLIAFGSHALGPQPLVNIESEQEVKRQIFDSKKILEARLDRSITMFSYPEGRFNDKIRQQVINAGYKVAVTTSPGKRFANDDIFALKRLRISSSSDNLFVFLIETSGFYTFIKEHRDAE